MVTYLTYIEILSVCMEREKTVKPSKANTLPKRKKNPPSPLFAGCSITTELVNVLYTELSRETRIFMSVGRLQIAHTLSVGPEFSMMAAIYIPIHQITYHISTSLKEDFRTQGMEKNL